ncbi:MAG: toprim domain-containing protein [Candidatus Taylorbacteria bacterium]
MDSLRRLEEIFAHFPGIGPRQARRFVHYLQGRPATQVAELVRLIGEVKSDTTECSKCHRYFIGNEKVCAICANPERDTSTLMIVARDSDLESVEKSGAYKGLYFVLGGTVPILDKEPEKKIRLRAMLERVSKDDVGGGSFNEIILSLNTTPDGEHTADIVRDALKKISSTNNATKITILGRGLSTGAELEYADSETIKNALGNRK